MLIFAAKRVMKSNFEKAKDIIISQTKLMKDNGFDNEFINDFNSNTIKLLTKKFNFNEEEISLLRELLK